jgi:hypothetical protein
MACGRAVIGTSAGGTQEYIVDKESGIIIPPRDSEALSAALIHLLKNKAELDKLGVEARTRAVKLFQRVEIARETVTLYEEAIKSFNLRKSNSLYMKDPIYALPDANELLSSYDRLLYDLLFTMSWSWRLGHWYRFIRWRPKFTLAKVLLKIARPLLSLTRQKPAIIAKAISELESTVSEKQKILLASSAYPLNELD